LCPVALYAHGLGILSLCAVVRPKDLPDGARPQEVHHDRAGVEGDQGPEKGHLVRANREESQLQIVMPLPNSHLIL